MRAAAEADVDDAELGAANPSATAHQGSCGSACGTVLWVNSTQASAANDAQREYVPPHEQLARGERQAPARVVDSSIDPLIGYARMGFLTMMSWAYDDAWHGSYALTTRDTPRWRNGRPRRGTRRGRRGRAAICARGRATTRSSHRARGTLEQVFDPPARREPRDPAPPDRRRVEHFPPLLPERASVFWRAPMTPALGIGRGHWQRRGRGLITTVGAGGADGGSSPP